MTTAVDSVLAAIEAQDQDHAAAFEDLVKQLADGKAPAATAVSKTLAAANKTTADLKAAVARLERRRKLYATYQRRAAAEAELPTALAGLKEARRREDTAKELAIRARYDELVSTMAEVKAAARE